MRARARSSFSPVSHPNLAHVIINRLITVDKNRKDTVLSERSERGCFMRNLLVKQFLREKGREKGRGRGEHRVAGNSRLLIS